MRLGPVRGMNQGMGEEACTNCGEPLVEGRINCPKCGTVYPDPGKRSFEKNPDEQGDAE